MKEIEPKSLGKFLHHSDLFTVRIYKDESEKWIVAEKCLKIFDFFVKTYEINPVDFPVMGQNKDEYPPPGFYIMLEMNTNEKSDLLK